MQNDEVMTLARALRVIEESGDAAEDGVTALHAALGQGTVSLEDFTQAFQRHAVSLRTQWRQTVDGLLADLARWTDGLHENAEGFAALDGGGMQGTFGALGTLVGLAGGYGKPPRVAYGNPAVPRPPGTLMPELLDTPGRQVAVTVAEGAVQITAQTLDESALARAADTLAAQIQARLAFEDRRAGRLGGG